MGPGAKGMPYCPKTRADSLSFLRMHEVSCYARHKPARQGISCALIGLVGHGHSVSKARPEACVMV
jgi:hypothetical protein